jgi:hypothetical protein
MTGLASTSARVAGAAAALALVGAGGARADDVIAAQPAPSSIATHGGYAAWWGPGQRLMIRHQGVTWPPRRR